MMSMLLRFEIGTFEADVDPFEVDADPFEAIFFQQSECNDTNKRMLLQ